MGLSEAIADYQVVGVDSNVFIYAYKEHPQFLPIVRPLFERLDADPEFRLVTSILTLIEVLVYPIRFNKSELMACYTDALLNKPKILSYLVDATIAHRAAELRARSSLRTPDAIQIATAVSVGAQAFITNAARLKNVPDIPVFIISEFV